MSGNGSISDFSCYMHQIIQHWDYMNVLSPEVSPVISLKRPPRGIHDGNGATIVHGVIPWSHMAFNIHNQTWHLPRMVMLRFIHYVINLHVIMCLICNLFVIYLRSYILYIYGLGEEWGGGGLPTLFALDHSWSQIIICSASSVISYSRYKSWNSSQGGAGSNTDGTV